MVPAGPPRALARRSVTWALGCGVAMTASVLPAGATPADAPGATPSEPVRLVEPVRPLLSASPDEPAVADDPTPGTPAADTTLIGLTTTDLLGDARDAGGPLADGGLPDDAGPFAPPPRSTQRPATIPVPGAVYMFPTGAALALYAGRRMRDRCRRRG